MGELDGAAQVQPCALFEQLAIRPLSQSLRGDHRYAWQCTRLWSHPTASGATEVTRGAAEPYGQRRLIMHDHRRDEVDRHDGESDVVLGVELVHRVDCLLHG